MRHFSLTSRISLLTALVISCGSSSSEAQHQLRSQVIQLPSQSPTLSELGTTPSGVTGFQDEDSFYLVSPDGEMRQVGNPDHDIDAPSVTSNYRLSKDGDILALLSIPAAGENRFRTVLKRIPANGGSPSKIVEYEGEHSPYDAAINSNGDLVQIRYSGASSNAPLTIMRVKGGISREQIFSFLPHRASSNSSVQVDLDDNGDILLTRYQSLNKITTTEEFCVGSISNDEFRCIPTGDIKGFSKKRSYMADFTNRRFTIGTARGYRVFNIDTLQIEGMLRRRPLFPAKRFANELEQVVNGVVTTVAYGRLFRGSPVIRIRFWSAERGSERFECNFKDAALPTSINSVSPAALQGNSGTLYASMKQDHSFASAEFIIKFSKDDRELGAAESGAFCRQI